jgi:hypothetical protein
MLTERRDLPARLAWEAVPYQDGHLVATSLPAGVHYQSGDGELSEVLSVEELGVTSMTRFDRIIYAGVSPSGTIYRLYGDERQFSAYKTIPDSYVWDMQVGPEGESLYVASGPGGKLHRLDEQGNLSTVATVPGHNIMDLVVHNDSLYVGDDRGGVYRLETPSAERESYSLESVYGFTRGEVAAMASDGEYLYLAVNVRQSTEGQQSQQQQRSELAAQLRQQSMRQQLKQRIKQSPKEALQGGMADSPAGPSLSPAQPSQSMLEAIRESAGSGQSNLFQGLSGTLVYRMDPPNQMNIAYNDPNEIVHDMEAADGNLFVATGGQGRLYKIKSDFTRVAYFQSDHRLILDVALEDGMPSTITTGEGAAIFQRKPFNKNDVYYRSSPMDAQLLSQWGTLKAIGANELQFRTRSGNSEEPDTNWTEWSRFRSRQQFSIESPPARFLQFEVRFRSPETRLKNVQIAYRIPNQQPQISTFDISPHPFRARHTHVRIPGSGEGGSSGSSPGQDGASMNMATRQIAWKAMDPDGDPLQSTLQYRPLGTEQWLTLAEPEELEGNSYNWNVADYSDGWYELRLEVSDKLENPPGQGYTAYQQLGPVLVDNTAPKVSQVRTGNGRLSFTARDKTSWILSAQYRINGGKWQPLQPNDGIFDQKKETFDFAIHGVDPGSDVIEIKVIDEGGNDALTRVGAQ